MTTCPYANLLGVPGEGVHKPRFLGLARNDMIATILVAIITSYIFDINIFYSFAAWFISGEILHYFFGTKTAFLVAIGLAPHC